MDSVEQAVIAVEMNRRVNSVGRDGLPNSSGRYAFFSGVAFITMIGVLFAPVIHRFFHKFHLEIESEANREHRDSRK